MIHRSGFPPPTRHQGVSFCSCPKQARPPAEGVSGQQTHADIWVERQSATSLSVPPRCSFSYGFTTTPRFTHKHTTTDTHKCICAPKPHTHKQRLHISANPVMTAHPTFHPPFPVCVFVSLSEVLLSPADFETSIYLPWFNCVVGKFCLKSLSLASQ